MKMGVSLAEKPWGQLNVPHLPADCCSTTRIGEVSFSPAGGDTAQVLIKYLYTSERLSIQVHPDDRQAQAFGHASGKDEMWIVLDAAPEATIGLGLKRPAEAEELRAAVQDGSIVDLVDWRPVARGDVIYNPAGTIHAAGAGLVLLEVQQAIDLLQANPVAEADAMQAYTFLEQARTAGYDPNQVAFYYAKALNAMNRGADAVSYAQTAVEASEGQSDRSPYYIQLGLAHMGAGNTEEARAAFEAIGEGEAWHGWAQHYIGQLDAGSN